MRKQLSEEVASYVREAIMAGEYAPGQPVRAEALGDTLEVSATPVREALQALRVEGFLDLVPRKGFTVAELSADDIRDIFAAHALIAGELAARAASNASPEALEQLDALHREILEVAGAGNIELLEQKNYEFHRAVYKASGSERLRWALGTFAKYAPRSFYADISGWSDATVNEHDAVLDALRARDVHSAREAMQQHIRNSGEALAEHFDRMRRRTATQ